MTGKKTNKQTTPPKKKPTKTTAEDPSGIRLCGREGSKFLSSQPGRGSSPAPPALSNRAAPALRPSAAAPERTDAERHRRPSSPPKTTAQHPEPPPAIPSLSTSSQAGNQAFFWSARFTLRLRLLLQVQHTALPGLP